MTHYFAVHDPATGAIKRAGSCSDPAAVALQAKAGEAVIETPALCNDKRFRVDVTKTPHAVVAKS